MSIRGAWLSAAAGLALGCFSGMPAQAADGRGPTKAKGDGPAMRQLQGAGIPVPDGETARVREGMVRIPSGTNSGTDPDFGAYSLTVEEPFHMDTTEVTWGKWREVREWAVSNGYDLVEVGSGRTPSLISTTSSSPTRTA